VFAPHLQNRTRRRTPLAIAALYPTASPARCRACRRRRLLGRAPEVSSAPSRPTTGPSSFILGITQPSDRGDDSRLMRSNMEFRNFKISAAIARCTLVCGANAATITQAESHYEQFAALRHLRPHISIPRDQGRGPEGEASPPAPPPHPTLDAPRSSRRTVTSFSSPIGGSRPRRK